MVASGFLNPENNNGGKAFGLWVSPSTGGALTELTILTGFEDNLIDDAIVEVYPNPANELININFNLTKESEVNVFIYDLYGRLEKSVSFGMAGKSVNKTPLNVSDLESGLYILSIQAWNTVVNSKIQISK